MTTMQQTTQPDPPPYVIVGEWRDDEWHAATLKYERGEILTSAEMGLLLANQMRPRNHPYGAVAWCCEAIDRETMTPKTTVFPTKEAHDAWLAIPRS